MLLMHQFFTGKIVNHNKRDFFVGDFCCAVCNKKPVNSSFYCDKVKLSNNEFIFQPIWFLKKVDYYYIFCGYKCCNDFYLGEKSEKN